MSRCVFRQRANRHRFSGRLPYPRLIGLSKVAHVNFLFKGIVVRLHAVFHFNFTASGQCLARSVSIMNKNESIVLSLNLINFIVYPSFEQRFCNISDSGFFPVIVKFFYDASFNRPFRRDVRDQVARINESPDGRRFF